METGMKWMVALWAAAVLSGCATEQSGYMAVKAVEAGGKPSPYLVGVVKAINEQIQHQQAQQKVMALQAQLDQLTKKPEPAAKKP